jgi:hypothetical protein
LPTPVGDRFFVALSRLFRPRIALGPAAWQIEKEVPGGGRLKTASLADTAEKTKGAGLFDSNEERHRLSDRFLCNKNQFVRVPDQDELYNICSSITTKHTGPRSSP